MPSQYNVLIVDDEPSVALTLKLIFERQSYAINVAYSCVEALQMLRDGGAYDAVITDLNMEREDIGLEVVQAAQQLRPRPVVIICTGYATQHNAQAALDLRVDYLATKPVDLQELLIAVERLLRRRQLTHEASA